MEEKQWKKLLNQIFFNKTLGIIVHVSIQERFKFTRVSKKKNRFSFLLLIKMISLLVVLPWVLLCVSSVRVPPWRSVHSFASLPDPKEAVSILQRKIKEIGTWGYVNWVDTFERYIVVDDIEESLEEKRATLYERIPLNRTRLLGYIHSEVQFYPTHDRPYFVYHMQDAICGENLKKTLYNPWLISYAIGNHEKEKEDKQSYHLLLSYNVKSTNTHWQNMLRKRNFVPLQELPLSLQNLTFDIYYHKQFFFPDLVNTQNWSTFFFHSPE